MRVVLALACSILTTLIPQSAVLRGRVVDSAGGALPGATVTVSGAGSPTSVVTDAHGRFQVEGVPVASYEVTVRLPGFRPRTTTFRADASASREMLIALELNLGQRQDPADDLRQYVEQFTGSEPRECGRHLLVQRERQWVAADEGALQKSVECGVAAASTRRAFWTFKQNQGIDAWIASGLLGTGSGVIYRFSYDSAPCGGPGCQSRITFERCDKPIAATGSNQLSEFRCAR